MKERAINLDKCTVVWLKNWEAINARCPVCDDITIKSCTFCHGTGRKYRYIINEGSSRSSKTYSLIDIADIYCRQNIRKRFTVWRDTKTDCVKTVLQDIKKHLGETNRWLNDHKYHATTSILTYRSQSTLEIHGTDDDNTVHGLTQDVAWINEPYLVSRTVFDQIDQRTTDFVMIDWNPKMAHWVDDIKKDPRAILIKSNFTHNPFCPPEQKAKILSYQPVSRCKLVEERILTEQQAQQYDCNANPLNLDVTELRRCQENEHKRSASDYNWSVYGLGEKAEKPNRIFHWKEIPLQQYLDLDVPTYTGVDWGAVDPWGILDAKYYDGAFYLRQRNYLSENDTRQQMDDTDRAQISGEEEGLIGWMFKKLGIPFDRDIICDNNRKLKILALREAGWEYAIECRKGPGSVIDGIDLLNDMPVYFTSDSPDLNKEQQEYSRQVDRYGVVLDEPEDRYNHLIDPARYIATFLFDEGIISKK